MMFEIKVFCKVNGVSFSEEKYNIGDISDKGIAILIYE